MISAELLFVVLVAAIVAALTPSTIGVLVQLATVILGAGKSMVRVFWLGTAFVATLFVTSLALGVAALYGLSLLPVLPASYIAIGVGILIVNAGLIEIKDYFWYGRGFGLRMHSRAVRRIKLFTKGRVGPSKAMTLGAYTAFAALPCVGPPYLVVLMLLRNEFSAANITLLAVYNLVFVLPLLLLIAAVASGLRLSTVQRWKQDGKGRMRLGVGLLLIMLGWILLLIANGVLNLG